MKRIVRSDAVRVFIIVGVLICAHNTQAGAASKKGVQFVITNDNVNPVNTATFYVAGAGPKLTQDTVVIAGGIGLNEGSPSLAVAHEKEEHCVFLTDVGSGDVAAMVVKTQQRLGIVKGSSNDLALFSMALAANSKFLYASFDRSGTIATFSRVAGCALKFVGDVTAAGMNRGAVSRMALRGSLMVVTYGDGSIQSFNISKGIPASNGDLQLSTGFQKSGAKPLGVDISQDGHFAVFGDGTSDNTTNLEVSDISPGKLTTTVNYPNLFPGSSSSNVWLSPDESLLYLSIDFSGEVAAAFFDPKTGVLTAGCSSGPLSGFNTNWASTAAVTTEGTSGTGGVVYVAEEPTPFSGNPSWIGIAKVASNGKTCSLTESTKSPVKDPQSQSLTSIATYPPRQF